ncbi:unnamed protein product [Urochloa humidicola]
MDVLLSAVATDLVGRVISFLVRKYQEPGATKDAIRLQRALLRAGAVVEEAEGRQIANRAMLLQLNQLRRDLYRGTYVLDALRWGAEEEHFVKFHRLNGDDLDLQSQSHDHEHHLSSIDGRARRDPRGPRAVRGGEHHRCAAARRHERALMAPRPERVRRGD